MDIRTRAIDHAFIIHMEGLFARFCADVESAMRANASLDHARQEYLTRYKFACVTHQEMLDHA